MVLIHLKIKNLKGNQFEVDVDSEATVKDFKEIIGTYRPSSWGVNCFVSFLEDGDLLVSSNLKRLLCIIIIIILFLIAEKASIPVDNQRLIFLGKVLKDE